MLSSLVAWTCCRSHFASNTALGCSGFNLYDFADRLCNRGWQVPAYSLPAHCEDEVIQRILVRQGVSHDLASLLLDTMREAIDYFEKRPVQVALTDKEASGFHH